MAMLRQIIRGLIGGTRRAVPRSSSNLSIGEKRPVRAPANVHYRKIIATTGVAQQGPTAPVPSGGVVHVFATNGTTTGNTADVSVGEGRDCAINGPNASLFPFQDTTFQVRNLNEIWYVGTATDGVEFSIREQ